MAGFKESPYDVLGVSPDTPMEMVKRRYKELAMQHHPDRWMGKGCSVEEMAGHKEAFQRITLAYHTLLSRAEGTETTEPPNWESVWKRMEDVFQRHSVFEKLSVFLKRTFEMRSAATAGASGTGASAAEEPSGRSYHSFTIPVSLEEIAQKKRKKVRLLLKTDSGQFPLIITVLCEKYPSYETSVVREGVIRHLNLTLSPTAHSHYTVDTLEDPEDALDETTGYNLFRGLPMTLMDYFTGKTVEWLHPSGELIVLDLPAFLKEATDATGDATGAAAGDPLYPSLMRHWKKIKGAGLLGKGDLWISFEWRFPPKIAWDTLNPEEKEQFRRILENLTRLNAFPES